MLIFAVVWLACTEEGGTVGRPVLDDLHEEFRDTTRDSGGDVIVNEVCLDDELAVEAREIGTTCEPAAELGNLVGLIEAVCTDDCDIDAITVSYALGNTGTIDIPPPVPFSLWGESESGNALLLSGEWKTTIRAGFLEATATATITNVPLPLYDVLLQVDGGNSATGVVDECAEDDNENAWGAYVCLNDE